MYMYIHNILKWESEQWKLESKMNLAMSFWYLIRNSYYLRPNALQVHMYECKIVLISNLAYSLVVHGFNPYLESWIMLASSNVRIWLHVYELFFKLITIFLLILQPSSFYHYVPSYTYTHAVKCYCITSVSLTNRLTSQHFLHWSHHLRLCVCFQ